MNKIIISIIVVSLSGALLLKVLDGEPIIRDTQSETISSSSEDSEVFPQNIPANTPTSIEKLVEYKTSTPSTNSNDFLSGTPEEYREAYAQVNERLFGILENISEQDYQKLMEKGFPSTNDFDFVSRHDIKEIQITLFNNVSRYPSFDEDPSLSYHALSSLNLLKALANLEEITRYYFPEYQQGTPFPKRSDWPDGERPARVFEAMIKVGVAGSVVMDESAIELLAQARFKQFAFNADDNNANIVVEMLAKANKLLGGNENLSNYVIQHYPEKLEDFERLSSE
ncbi:MAG: hypothetical protein MK214_11830 [Thalassotalea sp.]|nr:hypothetical protein [Thalassotalea sp.]